VIDCPPNPPGIVATALGQRADEYARRLERLGAFAGVVLIARGDTVLLHRGYGRSNDATCAPMTSDTRFSIASIAKQFTGAAIVLLESEGKLRTDDPITRWVDGVPSDKATITIAQLATHTSGLPNDWPDFFARARAGSRDTAVRAILETPLESSPGTRFAYSNLGYVLLAAIVERASGMSFEEFVRRRLFVPARLTATTFLSDSRRWPDSLVAHTYWDQYDAGTPRDRATSWFGLGASQIVSTAADLRRWLVASRAVLGESAYRKWMEPGPGMRYAFGWNSIVRPDGSLGVVFHSGGDTGAGGELRWYPRTRLTVVVLTNRQHQDQLMQVDLIANLTDVVNARSAALPPPAGTSPALPSGTYETGGGARFIVWRAPDGRVWIAPEGQRAFDVLLPPDSTAAARVAAAHASVAQAVDSLSKLSCGGVSRGSEYPQAVPQTLITAWCRLSDQLGAVRSVDTIGVRLPAWSDKRAFIYTRVHFARGTQVLTWLFENDQLIEMWRAPSVLYPQSMVVVEESPGVLMVYDYFRGSGERLLVGRRAGVATIEGVAGGSELIARLVR
jgi:CubicO group peptidase (beta-lactamase class C family)